MTPTTKPLLSALSGKVLSSPPIWLMRQAGRWLPEYRALRARHPDFLAFCRDPDAAAEATLQPVRRLDLDAAIIFSDILVIPDALGRTVTFTEGEGPSLRPIVSGGEIGALFPAERVPERLEAVYRALEKVRAGLRDDRALIGFAGAPWTLACYMTRDPGDRDFLSTRIRAHRDAGLFDRLIEILTEAVIAHLVAQIDAGAETVQLFDSWAGGAPEAMFRRWIITPTRRIVDAVHASRPGVPVIGFPRGVGAMIAEFVQGTGVDAVSLDTQSPLSTLARTLEVPIQGNLDPAALVAGGPALERAIREIRDATRGRPFVFNLGHGVPPDTPVDHVADLVRWVRAA